MALRPARRVAGALLIAALAGCNASSEQAAPAEPAAEAPSGPVSVRATLGGDPFDLELVADPASRHVGMGGRNHLADGTGMLFAFRDARPRAFVMRDCVIPLDVAFLDAEATVVAIHSMSVEPPRRAGETPLAYEARLPEYPSGAPAQFAIETAQGELARVGLAVGDRVAFDRAAVLRLTR